MIHFVQSIWLWAIAGIAVPLFIHLWNIRKGKTLKVGSIAFLADAAKTHSKSLRVSDWLLLLLRCLLLALLAILLTSPYVEQQDNTTKEKGWILMEKQELAPAYNTFTPTIDSLLKEGYVLHFLDKGFPQGALSDSAGAGTEDTNNRVSYWTRLRELDQRIPSTLPVYLFTGNQLKRFSGTRPAVALNLHWSIFPSADTSLATSAPPADTTQVSVCIFSDKPGMGANYVKAALEAIREMDKRTGRIILANDLKGIQKDVNWLFWLSESNPPPSLAGIPALIYEKGIPIERSSAIITEDKTSAQAGEIIACYKQVEHRNERSEIPVWTNAYGETLLGKENTVVPRYHFYSRFDPQWNGLTWSAQFPRLLHGLLYNPDNIHSITAAATIDPQQMLPAKQAAATAPPKTRLLRRTELEKVCWILALILFGVERILTYRKKKEVVDG